MAAGSCNCRCKSYGRGMPADTCFAHGYPVSGFGPPLLPFVRTLRQNTQGDTVDISFPLAIIVITARRAVVKTEQNRNKTAAFSGFGDMPALPQNRFVIAAAALGQTALPQTAEIFFQQRHSLVRRNAARYHQPHIFRHIPAPVEGFQYLRRRVADAFQRTDNRKPRLTAAAAQNFRPPAVHPPCRTQPVTPFCFDNLLFLTPVFGRKNMWRHHGRQSPQGLFQTCPALVGTEQVKCALMAGQRIKLRAAPPSRCNQRIPHTVGEIGRTPENHMFDHMCRTDFFDTVFIGSTRTDLHLHIDIPSC